MTSFSQAKHCLVLTVLIRSIKPRHLSQEHFQFHTRHAAFFQLYHYTVLLGVLPLLLLTSPPALERMEITHHNINASLLSDIQMNHWGMHLLSLLLCSWVWSKGGLTAIGSDQPYPAKTRFLKPPNHILGWGAGMKLQASPWSEPLTQQALTHLPLVANGDTSSW